MTMGHNRDEYYRQLDDFFFEIKIIIRLEETLMFWGTLSTLNYQQSSTI